jgi:hypothetical protein
MFGRLFPKQFNNDYRGHTLAIWLLAVIVLLKILQSVNAMDLNPWIDARTIAQTADRIPIDSFTPVVADIMMLKTKVWGYDHLLLNLIAVIALIRYRTMIPFMYLVLLADQVGRRIIVAQNPIERSGEVSLALEIALLATIGAMFIGFVLSQVTPAGRAQPAE